MFKSEVVFWKEDGWEGHKNRTETWEAKTKEDLFLKMLSTNNRLQKAFDKNKQNSDCWRFPDENWELQEEYDKWWLNLSQDKKDEIFEKA